MSRKQCAKCPWKKSTNPRDIPNGYCPVKHRKLRGTIAEPGAASIFNLDTIRVMACHESPIGEEEACVGWLVHQLGPGNNLALRMAVSAGKIDANVETIGEQHQTFEETLPHADLSRGRQSAR